MSSTRNRSTGDKGVAIIMVALALIPLMTFAAFGVDLASWYSRVSYIQKSADAASLAGTVWMPDINEARAVACASLLANGISGNGSSTHCGSAGDFEITIEPGSTATSLRVIVTDPSATRYFSQVLGDGDQRLTRSAEAEYNLPIPLGSPLNYFGGDASRTQPPTPDPVFSVAWPTDATTRRPVNFAPDGCNVGTSSGQGLGAWSSGGSFNAGNHSNSDPQCQWTVTGTVVAGTSSVPPPDYSTRAPNNPTCRVRDDGSASGTIFGRWNAGSPPTWTTNTGGSSGMCVWNNMATDVASIPPGYDSFPAPTNRACRIGYETTGPGGGHWTSGGSGTFQATTPGSIVGENQSTGNRLCQWTPQITSFTPPTPPNPIAANRSPGFWASISGPGGVATQGNAYSVRCTFELNDCSNANLNTMHRDTGFWYVVKIPSSGAASTDIRVFDASYNIDGTSGSGAGDSSDDDQDFNVEYRVFQQTNPLDFTERVPTAGQPGAGNNTPGSCWWDLEPTAANVTTFGGSWQNLCTIAAPANGDLYLVNVRTTSDDGEGAGVNSYALEAISSACGVDEACQPTVYAFADMGMYNNLDAGLSTFYLAEVGPQFAGKTLVIELWDSGDANGVAEMTPMMPSAAAFRPVTPVPSGDCTYGADTPNPRHDSSQFGGATSPGVAEDTVPAGATCTIVTANQPSGSGTPRRPQYNDEWLTIKVSIPADYSCVLGVNPENTVNSCWWGIQYDFSAAATDVTTWRARIEGNPVHLTQ